MRKEGNTTPFRPGMTASVDIITERKNDILTVPLAAVTTRSLSEIKKDTLDNASKNSGNEESTSSQDEEKKEVVFLYKDGIAKIVEVKTGISDYDNIEILEGVKLGDQVVSGPFLVVSRRLKDGDAIVSDKKEGGDEKATEEEVADTE